MAISHFSSSLSTMTGMEPLSLKTIVPSIKAAQPGSSLASALSSISLNSYKDALLFPGCFSVVNISVPASPWTSSTTTAAVSSPRLESLNGASLKKPNGKGQIGKADTNHVKKKNPIAMKRRDWSEEPEILNLWRKMAHFSSLLIEPTGKQRGAANGHSNEDAPLSRFFHFFHGSSYPKEYESSRSSSSSREDSFSSANSDTFGIPKEELFQNPTSKSPPLVSSVHSSCESVSPPLLIDVPPPPFSPDLMTYKKKARLSLLKSNSNLITKWVFSPKWTVIEELFRLFVSALFPCFSSPGAHCSKDKKLVFLFHFIGPIVFCRLIPYRYFEADGVIRFQLLVTSIDCFCRLAKIH